MHVITCIRVILSIYTVAAIGRYFSSVVSIIQGTNIHMHIISKMTHSTFVFVDTNVPQPWACFLDI